MATITREQVETILRINGVPPAAPEEQIKSILLSARFNDDEIDAAIMVLRENSDTKQSRVQGAHKIINSSSRLSASEISSLLGIDVDIDELHMDKKRIRQISNNQFWIIFILALTLAISSLTFVMYISETGVFHPSMQGEARSISGTR